MHVDREPILNHLHRIWIARLQLRNIIIFWNRRVYCGLKLDVRRIWDRREDIQCAGIGYIINYQTILRLWFKNGGPKGGYGRGEIQSRTLRLFLNCDLEIGVLRRIWEG